jgi:hypothetical protein
MSAHRGKDKPYGADDFRAELVKIMPGYQWTVHRAGKGAVKMSATGIQSSGFNRLSTLRVTRSIARDQPWYTAKSAGYGTRAPFLHENGDVTLARALRGLQEYYEQQANKNRSHAACLANARTLANPKEVEA